MSTTFKEPITGVKVYNVAGEKLYPEWMTKKEKKELSKDEDYNNRIELLNNFVFPTSSQRMEVTRDGKFLVVTGIYPPQVRVYELDQLSHHFTRCMNSEIVQMSILSDDYSKMCFMCVDRTIEFHTKGGVYHKTRIPKVGRDMVYNENTALLYACGSSSEIYRLHLEQGRFYSSLQTTSKSFNTAAINPVHSLLAFGSTEGIVHFFDPREPKELNNLDVGCSIPSNKKELEVTAFRYHSDGLSFIAGTSTGHCAVYDLRSDKPMRIYDHKYGFPINTIRYHSEDMVVSSDKKIIKVWNQKTGEIMTNIEPHAEINEFCLIPRVSSNFSSKIHQNLNIFSSNFKNAKLSEEELENERKKNSGLILIAPENKENIGYFIPTLGPAPTWCSFLDNLTEELHNQKITQNHYEDYKFVTSNELDRLALSDIIGTRLVKPYMHGFFISMKLYQKMKAVIDPFAWERYKKERVKDKIAQTQKSKIFLKSQNTTSRSVNKQLVEAMDDVPESTKKSWTDTRFGDLFNNPNFEIDPNSSEFARVEKYNSFKSMKMLKNDKIAGFSKVQEEKDDEDVEDDEEQQEEGQEEEGNQLYEVDEEDINQIAFAPQRDEIFRQKDKIKKRLLGDRVNENPVSKKKSQINNTITYTPQAEIDKRAKVKMEIEKRIERNKTRRKAKFR